MANVKISALTAVTAPATTDVVPIVNAGATKKVTIANLVGAVQPDISCRLQVNASIPVLNATLTVMTFGLENFDTDTMHDLAVNPNRITIKTAGKYLIGGAIPWEANASGYRRAIIVLNASLIAVDSVMAGVATQGITQNISTLLSLAVNDYLELKVSQNSGVTLGITYTGYDLGNTHFWATKVG